MVGQLSALQRPVHGECHYGLVIQLLTLIIDPVSPQISCSTSIEAPKLPRQGGLGYTANDRNLKNYFFHFLSSSFLDDAFRKNHKIALRFGNPLPVQVRLCAKYLFINLLFVPRFQYNVMHFKQY